jgi:hypothetical protein
VIRQVIFLVSFSAVAVTADSSRAVGEGPSGDATSALKLVRAADEPLAIASIYFANARGKAGDVVLEIENRSHKAIRYAAYTVGWPDCPLQRVKPGAQIVSYGNIGTFGIAGRAAEDRPIKMGGRAVLRIPLALLDSMERWKRKYGCAASIQPELVLSRVAFNDGTGWEGFAGGPKHDQWTGRPWTPPFDRKK